jgi:hypothetical protein
MLVVHNNWSDFLYSFVRQICTCAVYSTLLKRKGNFERDQVHVIFVYWLPI